MPAAVPSELHSASDTRAKMAAERAAATSRSYSAPRQEGDQASSDEQGASDGSDEESAVAFSGRRW